MDVGPFVVALGKMITLFSSHGLDILKDAVSISKLAFMFLLKSIPQHLRDKAYFYCPSKRYKTLAEDLRKATLGGASIIFKRFAERGKPIHDAPAGETAEKVVKDPVTCREDPVTCREICGLDCNSLYPYTMQLPQPCGHPIIRLKENDYRVEHAGFSDLVSLQWFMWIQKTEGYTIEHKFNGPERCVGARRIPVDGFMKSFDDSPDTVFQFHGCYFHGCLKDCHDREPGDFRNGKIGKQEEQWWYINAQTTRMTNYLRDVLKLNVVEIWECEWKEKVKKDKIAAAIAADPFFIYQPIKPPKVKGVITEKMILDAIMREKNPLYGFISCDVTTPEHLKAKYDQFPLVYRHYEIDRDDLEPWMRPLAEAQGYLKTPSKLLITCHEAKNILIATPLAKFYLQKGLKISNIDKVYQYKPIACFEEFVTTCQEKRIDGDLSPDKALYAKLYKDVANHSYVFALTRKDKHRLYVYANVKTMRPYCRKNTFCNSSQVGKNLHEVVLDKDEIKVDLPLQIGVMVYNMSKLRMLEFVYDCILKYCKPTHIGFLSTDTDSLYLQLGAPDLHGCLKPELKQEFYNNYDKWFPAPFCAKHRDIFIKSKMADQPWPHPDSPPCPACTLAGIRGNRQVGLFKSEYSGGHWFVGLCSKTYAVGVDDSENNCKVSCKGISQKISKLRKKDYLKVLETQTSGRGLTKGFIPKKHKMLSYEQEKFGLSFFYCKRVVKEDGINTSTLEVKEKKKSSHVTDPPRYDNSLLPDPYQNRPFDDTTTAAATTDHSLSLARSLPPPHSS